METHEIRNSSGLIKYDLSKNNKTLFVKEVNYERVKEEFKKNM